ncbi:MAG TPA: PaaI family thioesterase [Burkholderiaceae bacterium]|nr:PaaI family thioesterase [Burkholderiaceae bacterium]
MSLLFGIDIPLASAFGIEGLSVGNDEARLRLPCDPRFANSRGDVSGGAIGVLFDCGLAATVRSHAPDRFGVVTVDLSCHFIASCAGDVTLTARCDRRGRTLSFARGEARDEHGKLIATATGVFILAPRTSQ